MKKIKKEEVLVPNIENQDIDIYKLKFMIII
jgi:hypothetical protein